MISDMQHKYLDQDALQSKASISDLKQRIQRINIVDLALHYATRKELRSAGTRFRCPCICGENTDRDPSVVLYPDQNTYHCFACSRGGGPLRLIMHAEGVDAKTAWKRALELSHTLGIAQPHPQAPSAMPHATATHPELYPVLDAMTQIFHAALMRLPRRHAVWQFMHARGLDETIAAAFHLGWTGTPRDYLPALQRRFSTEMLINAGLLKPNQTAIFWNRLVFPITIQTQTHYLVGRTVPVNGQSSDIKYLGLLATEYVARTPWLIGANHPSWTIVVEGPIDAIAIATALKLTPPHTPATTPVNVVALLGLDLNVLRSLHEKQMLGQHVLIALDQDASGIKAALELAAQLVSLRRQVHLLLAPNPLASAPWMPYVCHRLPFDFDDPGELLAKPECFETLQQTLHRTLNPPDSSPTQDSSTLAARLRALLSPNVSPDRPAAQNLG